MDKNSSFFSLDRWILSGLNHPLCVTILLLLFVGASLFVAPFSWISLPFSREPISFDLFSQSPRGGEVIRTLWPGASPQEIEDEITRPLSSRFATLPGVRSIRTQSFPAISFIELMIDERMDVTDLRTAILQRLQTLPDGFLPAAVVPSFEGKSSSPVYWYTLEGRDQEGKTTTGWSLEEVRAIQDAIVRPALLTIPFVSEVASIGGYGEEYQVEVDPEALQAYGVPLASIVKTLEDGGRNGVRTMDLHGIDHLIELDGSFKSVGEVENSLIPRDRDSPVPLKEIATFSEIPQERTGILNKNGAEVVGGGIAMHPGVNMMMALQEVRRKVVEITKRLPNRERMDGTISQLSIIPFYDRAEFMEDCFQTWTKAVSLEIFIIFVATLAMVRHIGGALIISSLFPLTLLFTLLLFKLCDERGDFLFLSWIAMAVGVVMNGGIILAENILCKLESLPTEESSRRFIIYEACREVKPTLLTIAFLTLLALFPFLLLGGEFFRPLLMGAMFAVISSSLISFMILPSLAYLFFPSHRKKGGKRRKIGHSLTLGLILITVPFISYQWSPLGWAEGWMKNGFFCFALIMIPLLLILFFDHHYLNLLRWQLRSKFLTLLSSLILLLLFPIFLLSLKNGWLPSFDEGTFLYRTQTALPTSLQENSVILAREHEAINAIPEVKMVVGRVGSLDYAIDSSMSSMMESFIQYHPEYLLRDDGSPLLFRHLEGENDFFRDLSGEPLFAKDGQPYRVAGKFLRDKEGELIQDSSGKPFRLWRSPLDPRLNQGRSAWRGIETSEDLWQEIVRLGTMPGCTLPANRQPIAAAITKPIAIKLQGATQEAVERLGRQLRELLHEMKSIEEKSIFFDGMMKKTYLQISFDRNAISQYGLRASEVKKNIVMAIEGCNIASVGEGAKRHPLRLRYQRSFREESEALTRLPIQLPTHSDLKVHTIPLGMIATIDHKVHPTMIQKEDGPFIAHLTFVKKKGYQEVDVLKELQLHLRDVKPADDVSYTIVGDIQSKMESLWLVRMAMILAGVFAFFFLYFVFGSRTIALIILTGSIITASGGVALLWLYGQSWFMNINFLGVNMRSLFQIHPLNETPLLWMGLLALFVSASHIGILLGMRIKDEKKGSTNTSSRRELVIMAAGKTVRPILIGLTITFLALLPLVTISGQVIPFMMIMALPSLGGAVVGIICLFLLPLLYGELESLHEG